MAPGMRVREWEAEVTAVRRLTADVWEKFW
jgi:hypothetical protein